MHAQGKKAQVGEFFFFIFFLNIDVKWSKATTINKTVSLPGGGVTGFPRGFFLQSDASPLSCVLFEPVSN